MFRSHCSYTLTAIATTAVNKPERIVILRFELRIPSIITPGENQHQRTRGGLGWPMPNLSVKNRL